MNFEQRLTQQQKQVQKLMMTQQLQQSIQMLQFNVDELASFLEQKALENPLIEVAVERDEVGEAQLYEKRQTSPDRENDSEQNYMNQLPDNQISLFEYVLEQIHMNMRETYLRKLVLFLCEYLDTNGYLKIDLETAAELTGASYIQMLDAMTLLQQLDPAGIGARDLRECLMLQTERDDSAPSMAYIVLEECFEAFADRKWKEITQKYDISLNQVQEIWDYVQILTPSPGAPYNGVPDQFIKPDIIVRNEPEGLKVLSAKIGIPVVQFQKDYYQEMSQFKDKEVESYLKDKFQEYEWIQKSLAQRGETIVRVGTAIVEKQQHFFKGNLQSIKPLTLKEIAEKIGVHESTVSRSVNGKYVETDFGIFELKSFFTSSISSVKNSDSDEISGAEVKTYLSEIVKKEDKTKPLSDQKIVELMKAKNIDVSRRTIAKYRDLLGIPPSSKRKRFE